MRKKQELLVPVGNMDSLYMAVYNGCDAIYLGGKRFGARAYAGNFTNEQLQEAILFAHLYDVKVYVTVNTMIFEREFTAIQEYLIFLDKINVDAVIVSDIGLVSWIHKSLPNLVIHMSTQAHTFQASQMYFWRELGVKRVVVDRELSLEEIKELPDILEIEVFIHGALCISYSGECLFSFFKDGRSGNRGTCSQSCRMPYKLFYQKKQIDNVGKYLLSTKELNTSHHIKELINSNITSFKIEGRMKSPEYVGFITRYYRNLLEKYTISPIEEKKLYSLFNREFTDGYLFNSENIMNFKTPNHQGIPIGKVIQIDNKKIKIKLTEDIHQEDGIRFLNIDEGFIVNFLYNEKGKLVNHAKKGEIVSVDNKVHLKEKTIVLKTLDKRLIDEIRTYPQKKIPITMNIEGTKDNFKLEVLDGKNTVVLEEKICEQALTKATTKVEIEKQLNRLGSTPFFLQNINIKIEPNLFIPVKKLNEIRRQAIEELIEKRKKGWKNEYSN